MTAGRSAGTEQGQGREDTDRGGECVTGCPGCAPSVPLARNSGRDEAREAVARWLKEFHQVSAESPFPRTAAAFIADADHLLSLPAVAALLRDGTTT